MPPVINLKISKLCRQFNGITYDGKNIFCKFCSTFKNVYDSAHSKDRVASHCNGKKHKEAVKLGGK